MAITPHYGAGAVKRRYLVPTLLIVALLISLNQWLQGTGGTRWLIEQASSLSDGEMQLGNIVKHKDEIIISSLHYSNSSLELSVDELTLAWQPWRFLLGHIYVDKLYGKSVALIQRHDTPSTVQPNGITLPLRIMLNDARLVQLSVKQAGTRQSHTIDTISLRASYWHDTLAVKQLQVSSAELTLKTSGKLATTAPFPLSFKVEGEYRHPEIERVTLTARLSGTPDHLLAEGHAILQGGVPAGASTNWQASYTNKELTFPRIEAVLPDNKGNAQISARISWKDEEPLRYQMNGSLHQLSWPLSKPGLLLARGEFSLTGSDSQYQLNAAASLREIRLPPSEWKLQGSGTPSRFVIESLQGILLDGTVQGSGEITRGTAWQWQWQGKIAAEGIDPVTHWPDWPGTLNGSTSLQGGYEQTLSLDMPDLKVEGKLHNQPVSLQSNVRLQGQSLSIETMALNVGGARLDGRLNLGDELNAQLSLNVPKVEKLWPGATGRIEAQLRSSGPRTRPHLMADIEANALTYERYALSTLKGKLDIDLSDQQPWQLTTNATEINLGIENLSPLTLALQGTGSAASHQVSMRAFNNQQQLDAELRGGWQQPQWQGAFTTLTYSGPHLGQWQQAEAFKLTLADSALIVERGCLESLPATLCLAYQHAPNAAHNLQLELDQFVLSRLKALTAEHATLDLPLDADVDLTLPAKGLPSGHLRLSLGSGTITPTVAISTQANAPIPVSGGKLFAEALGKSVETDMQLHLAPGSQLHGSATLQLDEGWRQHPEQLPLQARLVLALQELELLSMLIEPLEDPEGRVDGELTVGGSLASPQLTGRLQLEMKQANLPRLGLSLRDTELIASSHRPGRLDLTLHSTSAKGQLRAQGWFDAQARGGWQSELTIAGENVEVSHIPEARVTLSPQLQLRAKPHQLNIHGEVHIDEARLEPRDIASATTPSKDVVILRREDDTLPESSWKINSDIRLLAANTIYLKGFGFTGYLGGDVRVIDEQGRPPRAQGKLQIVTGASYRAFGQDLKAEHGRLYYADAPLENPTLDINAARKVGDVVAGVKVEGTAQVPRLTLFSRPAMDQIDVLSYLTLGRPFARAGVNDGNTMREAANSAGLAGGDYLLGKIGSRFELDEARIESDVESSEPWLVLGRYLSPRLYVRYGVGIMEGGNSLIMRYQLDESWSLQGEVGKESGSDLIYTIERP